MSERTALITDAKYRKFMREEFGSIADCPINQPSSGELEAIFSSPKQPSVRFRKPNGKLVAPGRSARMYRRMMARLDITKFGTPNTGLMDLLISRK